MKRRIYRLAGLIAGFTTLSMMGLSSPVYAGEKNAELGYRDSTLIAEINPSEIDQKLPSNPPAPSNKPRSPSHRSTYPNLNNRVIYVKWYHRDIPHYGKIYMQNRYRGYFYVKVRGIRKPIRQTIVVKRGSNGWILQGRNPTHPNYSPDRFRCQLSNTGNSIKIDQMERFSGGSFSPIDFKMLPRT